MADTTLGLGTTLREKPEVPEVSFKISRLMNQFCHFSVLNPECMHQELSNGMLANMEYRRQNTPYSRTEIAEQLRKVGLISPGLWYSFARALMKSDSLDNIPPHIETESRDYRCLLGVLHDSLNEYDDIWKVVGPRLEEYRQKFATEWSLIGDIVLSKLSRLTKQEWGTKEVVVQFVDCLYGGFGWVDSIALTPVPEMDIGKKLLAHELSELITPKSIILQRLRGAGLEDDDTSYEHSPTHTVVDMMAYFSVRDYLNNPERKGMKPNPSYYPCVEALYPLFETYSADPAKYDDFEVFLQDVVLTLKDYSFDLIEVP